MSQMPVLKRGTASLGVSAFNVDQRCILHSLPLGTVVICKFDNSEFH